MIDIIFSSVLGAAIALSLLQGLIIYSLIRVIQFLFPAMPANHKYALSYAGLVLIFVGFCLSVIKYSMINEGNMYAALWEFSSLSPTASENTAADLSYPELFTKWLKIIYIAGVGIKCMVITAGMLKLFSIRQNREWDFQKNWTQKLTLLSSKLGIEKKVRLLLIDTMVIPFTAGFIRPVIVFPVAMVNSLSPEQVETILLHELAHIRRNDYLMNMVQKFIEAILFFNPFVAILCKNIQMEREFCCDDLVLEHTNNSSSYARALLSIAENNLDYCSIGVAATNNQKFTLLQRIKRLTNRNKMNSKPKHSILTIVLVMIAGISLAWIIPVREHSTNKNFNIRMVNLSDTNSTVPLPPPAPVAPGAPVMPVAAQAPEIAAVPKVIENMLINLVLPIPEKLSVPAPVAMPLDMIAPLPPLSPDTNEIKKFYNSPEWKKQIQDMKVHSEEMKKHFESPEFKKQMQDIKINAEQMKSHALAMQKKFDSPEWKKKIEDMKLHSLEMQKQFDSPEWKKKIEEIKANSEEIKKQFESPEWKKQIEEIKKAAQEMKLEAEKVEKKLETPKN